jgi:sulfur-oxidizing protein SoxY
MSIKRRTMLKGALAGSAVGVAVGAGLLTPQRVLAAWPKAAFEATAAADALKALNLESPTASGDITVTAPDIAENGAVVPVTVATTLAGLKSITLLSEKNPVPLIASFDLGEGAEGYVSTRIKMGATSDVRAVVLAGGKVYEAKKEVKVTIGGCGG